MENRIIIIGAGGHGKVVCDAIIAQQKYNIIGFVDASVAVGEIVTSGLKVIAAQDELQTLKGKADFFIVAIGNNEVREKIFLSAGSILKPAIVIHPSAIIGSAVTIGNGSVVLAYSVVNASSVIGTNTIINAGVIVDHDCRIGNNVHLSVGTLVGSNSEVGDKQTTAIGFAVTSFSKIN